MAKKARGDRSDPGSNKSLAIRNVLQKMPKAKAADVAAAVEQEYGHKVSQNMVYMIKSKMNLRGGAAGARKGAESRARIPINSATTWVEAIRLGKQLLRKTGSVENATAILKAVSD